jgi:hypothetical protein
VKVRTAVGLYPGEHVKPVTPQTGGDARKAWDEGGQASERLLGVKTRLKCFHQPPFANLAWLAIQGPASYRRKVRRVMLNKLIYYLTLSIKSSRLKGVREGSPALRKASRKAGKWPLNVFAGVFASAIRANGGGNIPRCSTGSLRRPERALGNLAKKFLPNLRLAFGKPGTNPFGLGGPAWNAS